jgi:hypothetical protein
LSSNHSPTFEPFMSWPRILFNGCPISITLVKQGTKIMCLVIAIAFFLFKFLATFSPLFQYPILVNHFLVKGMVPKKLWRAWCHHSQALVLHVSLVCHVNKQTNKQNKTKQNKRAIVALQNRWWSKNLFTMMTSQNWWAKNFFLLFTMFVFHVTLKEWTC